MEQVVCLAAASGGPFFRIVEALDVDIGGIRWYKWIDYSIYTLYVVQTWYKHGINMAQTWCKQTSWIFGHEPYARPTSGCSPQIPISILTVSNYGKIIFGLMIIDMFTIFFVSIQSIRTQSFQFLDGESDSIYCC